MLVSQTYGVAEFVCSSSPIKEAKIHCRLVQRNVMTVGADVRPGAVIGVECDPYFCVWSVVEIEFEIRNLLPPVRLLSRR